LKREILALSQELR